MQVAGGIASGVFTESGWALDRPAAAAMVLGDRFSLGYADNPDAPIVSWAGGTIPSGWRSLPPRFGGAFGSTFAVRPADANAIVWQQARLTGDTGCSVQVHGARIDIGVSRGWQALSTPQTIEHGQGYEVRQLGQTSALKSLISVLPRAFRLEPERHLHQLVALLGDAGWLRNARRTDRTGPKTNLGNPDSRNGRNRHAGDGRETGPGTGEARCPARRCADVLVHRS
jgi:hypothetical protein